MRSAVLIGTDFAYDSKGKLIPLEINTNVGWDTVNRKESVDEIFDFTDLSMYVRENAIKEILLEGKIAEICKDAIQKAIPHVTVSEATMGDYEEEHPNTTLFVRTAWSSQAFVDTFAASKEKFKSLIKSEDFCEAFSEPSGNLPNLVVKAVDPQYDRLEYPKFYKADVSVLKVPHGFIVEPAVLNVDNLVEGRIPVFRNWSLFVAGENGDKIDTIYLGTYTKVCGDEFDESKLKYNSDGALVEGRGMLLSLDGLSTQWPADALVEASDEVLMSDGSWKKASELKVGDKVKSLQFEDSLDIRHHVGQLTTTEKELKKSFAVATVDFLTRTRGYRDFVEIKFNDKSDWFDTANSSYLVKRESGLEFDYISNLRKGDVVYFLKDGSKLATKTVESTGTVRKYVDTYNVGLAENHVFFSRGEGETGAFASLEHNDDTEDCNLDPKSQNGAFQTFISFDGTEAAKGTLNISTSGVLVSSESTAKTFAKTSGTASANGEYVNPNEYSSDKGGFTGCWYPLAGNSTWNVSVPLTVVDGVKSVATIVRLGSADGNALNGSNTYWKFTEIGSTGSNVLWPVTFSSATGPCKLHVQVYQPSDIIQVTEPTGKNFEADGTVTSGNTTASISFPQGTGTKGNVSGSIVISKEFLDFDYVGAGIVTGSSGDVATFDSNKAGEIKYSTKAKKNDTFNVRYDTVSTRVSTTEGTTYEVGFYTMQQKALEPTLSISPEDVELPASYSAGDYRISVDSNVPWTASLEAASASGYEIVNGSGTGSGEFIIRPVSESVRYSYDGLALRELVKVSTSTGKSEKDLTKYLLVYKNTKLFVKPEITFLRDIFQSKDQADCISQVAPERLIQTPFILSGDPSTGGSDSYDISDPSYNLADGSGGNFDRLKDLRWRVLGCVPIQVENVIPEAAVTIGVYSEDLGNYIEPGSIDPYPYGLIYVGSGKDSQVGYGDDIPVLFVDANTVAGVNSQLVKGQSLSLSEDCAPSSSFGLFGQNAKPTPCILIGTGSVITTTASIELFMRYRDLVTGNSETVVSSYTIGDNATFYVDSEEWTQALNAAMYSLSASGLSSIIVRATSLEPTANYKFIGTNGLSLRVDRTEVLNVVKTGQEWMTLSNDQDLQLYVLPNENSGSRILCLALVPENNGTVEDLSNEMYWNECNESTGYTRNGTHYMYQYVSQEGSSSKTLQNDIRVQCNPISVGVYGSTPDYYNAMFFSVTASARYPVSSSVSVVLMPGRDTTNNILYRGPVTVSIAKGATQGTYGDVDSLNCLMWYGNGITYRKSALTLPGVTVESVVPETDSFFKYETGNSVAVASVLGLGGDKVITGSKSYKLAENIYTGYTVSSSAEDVCTCTLRKSLLLNDEGMYLDLKPGTRLLGGTSQISLLLNGKLMDRCEVTYRNEITPVEFLKCTPNNISKDTAAGAVTVTLYTGSALPLLGRGLVADSVSSSSGWISVERRMFDSSGDSVDGNVNYQISTTTATVSRSGSVTFTKDGRSCILGVTQSQASKVVNAWFVPVGDSSAEQQINGSATVNLTTTNRYQLSNSRYMYCFRYENYGQVRFKPVFEPVEGSTVQVTLDLDQITDTEGYTTAASGNFYLTVVKNDLNVSTQKIGTLSFQSTISDAMVPKATNISSQVH